MRIIVTVWVDAHCGHWAFRSAFADSFGTSSWAPVRGSGNPNAPGLRVGAAKLLLIDGKYYFKHSGRSATVVTAFLAFLPRWTVASRKSFQRLEVACRSNSPPDLLAPRVARQKSAHSRNRLRRIRRGDVRRAERPSKHRRSDCPEAGKRCASTPKHSMPSPLQCCRDDLFRSLCVLPR